MTIAAGQALYVYGFVLTKFPETGPWPCPGVDDAAAPFVSPEGPVGVILSPVALAEFCGPAAERRLQDLAWLAPRACRHQAVLDEAVRRGPVWPARFGTLFASFESLRAYVARHRDTIVEFLTRMAGHEEWAVKAVLNRTLAVEQQVAARRAGGEPVSPGTAYLIEQRWRRQAAEDVDTWVAETCDDTARDLREYATDFRARRVLDADGGDAGECPVAHWAFLVPLSARAAFRNEVEKADDAFAGRGLSFRVSGPWPPASFCPALEAP